nr:hypothetical protein GCM10010200_042590 [Actinomadura rugatobispora]
MCCWEDVGQDDHNADEYQGGPNHVTLTEARRNFATLGVSDPRRLPHGRDPYPHERPLGKKE